MLIRKQDFKHRMLEKERILHFTIFTFTFLKEKNSYQSGLPLYYLPVPILITSPTSSDTWSMSSLKKGVEDIWNVLEARLRDSYTLQRGTASSEDVGRDVPAVG